MIIYKYDEINDIMVEVEVDEETYKRNKRDHYGKRAKRERELNK